MFEVTIFPPLFWQIMFCAFAGCFLPMSGIPQYIAWFFKRKRLKPFDCEFCMGFHAGWLFFHFHEHHLWLNSFAFALPCAVLSTIIYRYAK